jgi:hydrogenase maturation protease
MPRISTRFLILACGNTLRGDDGIGPWLAQWAEEKFRQDPGVRIISRQQWTPDLADEIARAESVLFIDCSIESEPGFVQMIEVLPSASAQGLATHHLDAPALLALTSELYDAQPHNAMLLAVGAGSTELGEQFSETVLDAIPQASGLIERTILDLLHRQA